MAHMLDEKEEEERRLRLRQNVLKEIIESENKYLQDLYSLILYYITPLKTNRFPEISANPKADVKMLFSTIELIFDGNNELLENLKIEYDKADPMVGKTFLSMIDKICQYYGVFCNHQKDAMDTIASCMKTSTQFKTFIDQCTQKPETNGLGLLDFLVKPFQRLLKYPLLFRELLKLTPESHPDRANIQATIDKLQVEVDKINKDKAKSDNMRKMIEINQSLEGGLPRGFRLLLPSRHFIYEGTLRKISGKNDQERHILLFSDCLMYCKKKSNTEFLCRGVIYLHKLQLEDIPDSFSFKIIRHDKNLTYVFYGKSKQEKETWMHEIKTQQAKIGVSFNKVVVPTLKKDVIRVYLNSTTFKSIAVTSSTTVNDVCDECSKKLKREVGATAVYKLALVRDEVPHLLEPEEVISELRDGLDREGVKLDDNNYFLVQEVLTN